MRIFSHLIFLLIFTSAWSKGKEDKPKDKLKTDGTISLNSNGIATIPAYSLEKPAVIGVLSLTKNRFSYEPILAYGFDLRPWFIENWMHYKIIDKPLFEFRTSICISMLFSDYHGPDDIILQGQRFITTAFTGVYKISQNKNLSIGYWNDRGLEPGTLSGHYFNIVGERSDINIGKSVILSTSLQLFYLSYDGNNDGLFITPKISSSIKKIPFPIFFQAIQVLDSNITPNPGFRWNIGLSYSL